LIKLTKIIKGDKMSRLERTFPVIGFSRRMGYDWEKLISSKTLKRHEWLAQIWTNLYFQNQDDQYIRNLSTDEIIKTKWFEKYGIREPQF